MKLQQTTGNRLLSLLIALAFALTMYPTKAKAQITEDLEVDVPFQFHAGNSKLPPGKYFIHVLDNSDLNIMEITSVDGTRLNSSHEWISYAVFCLKKKKKNNKNKMLTRTVT